MTTTAYRMMYNLWDTTSGHVTEHDPRAAMMQHSMMQLCHFPPFKMQTPLPGYAPHGQYEGWAKFKKMSLLNVTSQTVNNQVIYAHQEAFLRSNCTITFLKCSVIDSRTSVCLSPAVCVSTTTAAMTFSQLGQTFQPHHQSFSISKIIMSILKIR